MAQSPFTKNPDGTKSWKSEKGDYYEITGIAKNGCRFSRTTASWIHANGINLWHGSVWLVRNGKRHLIKRVTN